MNAPPFRPRTRLAQILGLAAAYVAVGRLSLLLALPPGYATAVWPAAGIALAGVLLFGARVWPGIVLGSFLVNVWTGLDPDQLVRSLLVPAGIGAGAALQAVVGAGLIRRFVKSPILLLPESDILKFMALGGPLSCLINATCGAGSLVLGGAIPPSELLFHWSTWWVGDSIGVFLFAPTIMVWTARPREIWRRRQVAVTLPLAVAFPLLVLLFLYASRWEQERLRIEFQRRVDSNERALNRSMDRYLDMLLSVAGFCANSPDLTRSRFASFVARPLGKTSGIQAVEWIPRISDAERDAHEEAQRNEGFPGYEIRERNSRGEFVRASRRGEYFPVGYVEPLAGNERVVGVDLTAFPDRRNAFDRARESGEPASLSRIRLIQETADQYGLLIIAPVYERGSSPGSREERRRSLEGFVLAVFRVEDMVEACLSTADLEGIELRIYGGDPKGSGALLCSYPLSRGETSKRRKEVAAETKFHLDVAGTPWGVEAVLLQEYLVSHRPLQAWSLLAGGLFLTGLLGAFLLVLTGHTVRVEEIVKEKIAELQQLNWALERSNRDLEQFAYSASHDLHEPLRMVSGFMGLLKASYEGKLDAQADEYIHFAVDGARRMQAMIDGILAYSRLGKGERVREVLDLGEVVREALDNLCAAVGEAGARIEADRLPTVSGNREEFVRIFQNLLANAVKFRGAEPPVVRVTAERRGGEWELCVRDNGIGIDPSFHGQLFQMFQRFESRTKYPGSGLGLALVRKIVELNGGRIWVESELGKGAAFYFTIPA